MRNKSRLVCSTMLALGLLPSASAQVMKFDGCEIDFELVQLPGCAVGIEDGRMHVLKDFAEYVLTHRQVGAAAWPVNVDGHRLAWTNLPVGGWAYFDRTGLVVVQNVATMDNGASSFHFGLVRVTTNGKWGLSNSEGKTVVPLTYDGILDFEPGLGWRACTGCVTKMDEEYSFFEGGRWVWLNRIGRVSGDAPDPMGGKRK
jgi:WG repeat protein